MNHFLSLHRYKQELSDVTSDLSGWWGGCEGVTQWMSDAEKTLSGNKPLASSVDIVKEQKTDIEVHTAQ